MLMMENAYSKPTTRLRTLALMEAIHQDGSKSQHDMCMEAAMSVAMVNQYVRRMADERLLDLEPVNGKSFHYRLTREGEEARRRYFGQYCAEIVQSYTALKSLVLSKLEPLLERDLLTLALYGASETCEVVLSAIRDTPFRVSAVVDSDPARQGGSFHGHTVDAPEALCRADCKAVVITSFGRQDEIFQELSRLGLSQAMEVVRL